MIEDVGNAPFFRVASLWEIAMEAAWAGRISGLTRGRCAGG
jgi:PIN domain nuclease of toxin-antitoxin system